MRHAAKSLCEADKRLRRHEERERVEGREGIAKKEQVCPSFRKSSQKKRVKDRRVRELGDTSVEGLGQELRLEMLIKHVEYEPPLNIINVVARSCKI